jgi:hypothetical protein
MNADELDACDMNADELRAEIERTQRAVQLKRQRSYEIEDEQEAATERQRLRRELETVQGEAADIDHDNAVLENTLEDIDMDQHGTYAPEYTQRPAASTYFKMAEPSQLRAQVVVNPAQLVEKLAIEWTIKGMSWLIAAMIQEGVGTHTTRERFWCAGNCFDLVYNPTAAEQGGASLSLRHYGHAGLACRHQFSILHADGDYRTWGEQGEVVLPYDSHAGALYGPDTPAGPWTVATIARHERQAEDGPIGVMGLDHQALTASEYVTEDCLHVKVELEVRKRRSTEQEFMYQPPPAETPAERIKVPPASALADMGALFGDGAHSDVVFRVGGERVPAHVCILAAR